MSVTALNEAMAKACETQLEWRRKHDAHELAASELVRAKIARDKAKEALIHAVETYVGDPV